MANPVQEKCSNGYCEIPGGTFQMGSTNGEADEQPVRDIAMTGFELGQTEVTIGQYSAFLGVPARYLRVSLFDCGPSGTTRYIVPNNGETKEQFKERVTRIYSSESCRGSGIGWEFSNGIPDVTGNENGDDSPIVGLTFDKKRAYCQAQGPGFDLPTAAMLHFASRYDDEDSTIGQLAVDVIAPITGGYKNRFGVYNLLGSVWESSLDAYDGGFYNRMASHNPYNPLTDQSTQAEETSGGDSKSLSRGWVVRTSGRGLILGPDNQVGFRCARPLPPDSKK